ncbi:MULTISPECIES: DASH family cryptochrome [Psychrobacter]|jgi:deoxyribodipyrimidine photo-lyase|uniref:DASH family cryptochrome n=1 Tax=Psychrobacter TaxID=497 RepID=UPI000C339DE3|nr:MULTISPECIES: DASH family cryptochrome [Psychrobacter]MBA6243215.1 DASH family cryptochrome [Psychrobacter sp. Urea-trap-18]MBA6286273.1 DASH family cryptochrome [Psychrobacter sp. Urea-trap-16]MBA6317422.1 DASH family cryptochrome [Psychrobacter sp. Urea-trap-20]MBA6334550.1 DASH family cryptochrome [Psychrobacter sp. Urea-trap-19]PKG60905.1 deoxyribodipyrimidine photolyase [Psychrobacter sp. Choline-3u-12]
MSNQAANNLENNNVTLVLFHNDLRVADNATLLKASKISINGKLLLVYASSLTDILDNRDHYDAYRYEAMGQARQQFLHESLADLNASLMQRGNRLLYLQKDDEALDVFTQLNDLIAQQQVTDICISQTADYNQNKVYDLLQAKYPEIQWHIQTTATLFDELPLEQLPKSFTQFRKQIETDYDLLHAEKDIVIYPTPESLAPLPDNMQSRDERFFEFQLPNQAGLDKPLQPSSSFRGGESNGLKHLDAYFCSDAPSTYKTTRNALDYWTHSTKFSAWLANGSLSVNTVLNRLRRYERDIIANDSTYWIWFELLWREYFYWYAVTHQQKLFWFKGIGQHAPSTQLIESLLAQWKRGTTQYPIVNACMNQLRTTGYMSNRGRQLVASCFIHELGLDWRYGAAYFEQHLVDYDVGSNWGNWQYLAGVGADPRGCRQFNLDKQTQQYDPNGEFIRQWQGNTQKSD